MKLTFTDRHTAWGEAVDDGTTYSWEYAGTDADVLEILEEAATWTDVDTAAGTDMETAERFDARLPAEVRLRLLQRALRPYTRLNELSE